MISYDFFMHYSGVCIFIPHNSGWIKSLATWEARRVATPVRSKFGEEPPSDMGYII